MPDFNKLKTIEAINVYSKFINKNDATGLKNFSDMVNKAIDSKKDDAVNIAVIMYRFAIKFENDGKVDRSVLTILNDMKSSLSSDNIPEFKDGLRKLYEKINTEEKKPKNIVKDTVEKIKESNEKTKTNKFKIISINLILFIKKHKIIFITIILLLLGFLIFFGNKIEKKEDNNLLSNNINNDENIPNKEGIILNKDDKIINNQTKSNFSDNSTNLGLKQTNPSKELGNEKGEAGGEKGVGGAEIESPKTPITYQNNAINNTLNNLSNDNNQTNNDLTNETIETPQINQTEQNITTQNNPTDCYLENTDNQGLTIFSNSICYDSTGSYVNSCASPINQDITNTFIKTFICINNKCSAKYYSCPVMGQNYFQNQNYQCVTNKCVNS